MTIKLAFVCCRSLEVTECFHTIHLILSNNHCAFMAVKSPCCYSTGDRAGGGSTNHVN